jgi:molybdopterin-guanine dinucleotide biosynthesis protein A
MGRDKALLQLPGGQTLLQRAQSLLRSLRAPPGLQFLPPLVSGERPGGIADSAIARGPLGGLHTVSEYLQRENLNCDALLAIPVDMPLLEPQQLEQLCLAGLDSGERPVCFGDFYLPLWLPLSERSRSYLQEVVEEKQPASVRALLNQLGFRQLVAPAGNWNCNINHPQEFEVVYKQLVGFRRSLLAGEQNV